MKLKLRARSFILVGCPVIFVKNMSATEALDTVTMNLLDGQDNRLEYY